MKIQDGTQEWLEIEERYRAAFAAARRGRRREGATQDVGAWWGAGRRGEETSAMTLAERLLAYSRTLGSVEPRRDGTISLSIILAADMASAMRTASGRLEELEMERDAARRAAR